MTAQQQQQQQYPSSSSSSSSSKSKQPIAPVTTSITSTISSIFSVKQQLHHRLCTPPRINNTTTNTKNISTTMFHNNTNSNNMNHNNNNNTHSRQFISKLHHHQRSSNNNNNMNCSSNIVSISLFFGLILLSISFIQLYMSTLSIEQQQQRHQHQNEFVQILHPTLPLQQQQQTQQNSLNVTATSNHVTSSSHSHSHEATPKMAATKTISKPVSTTISNERIDEEELVPHTIVLKDTSITTTTISSTMFHDKDDENTRPYPSTNHHIRMQQQQQPRIVQLPLELEWETKKTIHVRPSFIQSSTIIQPKQIQSSTLQDLMIMDDENNINYNNFVTTTSNDAIWNSNNTTDEIIAIQKFNMIKAVAMEQYNTECVPMVSWHTQSYPTCNTLHEMDITSTSSSPLSTTTISNDDISLLSDQGSWRSVWKVQRNLFWKSLARDTRSVNDKNNQTDVETIVLKLLKFQRRDFDEESFHHHRIDAMTMERLTKSTHIVNIYGYCGQSVMTEYAAISARSLTKDRSLSSLDRLKLGRDIVQAMVHLHSIDYDNSTNITMTHNDLNMANAVAVQQQIKLNDFNIGIPQRWNTSSNTICKTPVLFEAPLWKSPEEIVASTNMKRILENITLDTLTITTTNNDNDPTATSLLLHHYNISTSMYWVDAGMTDMFGLGNILFQILTKCQPWTHLEIDGPKSPNDAAIRKVRGEFPYIPPKYHLYNTSKISYAILHYAIIICYQRHPIHRDTSHELLHKLNTAIHWIDTRNKKILNPYELQNLFLYNPYTNYTIPI